MVCDKSVKRLLALMGQANNIDGVGGNNKDVLRVLMPGDVALMDDTSTDCNGRVCLVTTPDERKSFYQRIFVDGDTAIVCDPTDGEETGRFPLDKLKIHGVLIAIVREMKAEERRTNEKFGEFREKFPADKLMNYYPLNWEYLSAVKVHYRGDGALCFVCGYEYGFAEGRRAERNSKRRERRKKVRQNGQQGEREGNPH